MPVLKKVPSYVKNVAKSVAYSAADVIKTDMPTVSAFLDNESNKEVGKIVYDNIKDLQSIRVLGRNTALALRRSKVWEAGELGLKSALEDIRTGKWYNKDRISMIEEQVLEETMGGWDDMDLDMDSMEFGAIDEPTKGDKLVAASVQIAVGKSADQISETTITAASAIMNQQKKSTELMYAQNFKLANEIRATVTNIGNKTNVYLDNIQNLNKTIAENNKKFFDVSTKLMQENNSMMKEMIEMQRNLYRNQQEIEKQREKDKSKQKPGYNDLVSMEGVLDIKEYGKFVKGNAFKTLDEQSGGMLSMMFGGFDGSGKGNLLKSFAASPLSFMSTMMISQLFPKNVKKSAGKLDTTLGGVVPTLLGNLNKAGKNSDNPLAQIVGKIFGVDTRVQAKLDTGKYEKGPMQFNGKANKSITEVIPELLSDILSTLSGAPKKLYDFEKGKWTTGRAIKREFDQMTKNNMKSSFSDLLGEMRDYIGGGKGPKFGSRTEADRFEQTLETFLTVLYNNDGSFNSKKDYEMYQLAGVSKSDYDMISKMIQNIGKRNHGVRMGLSANVMSNKQTLNNQMKAIQEKGGVFNYLFNGTDANKLYKTPKYEDAPIPLGVDLNKTLDNKGNNVFYYLQNIYDEMYRIRMFGFGINGRSGWRNGPAPGRPFNESIYNISRIENNHKQSAKERYSQGEQSKDVRYQEMIEKFTKEGGQLYDLVDDKGNINLINATAEQKQIADMIEQARVSGGFIQDTLFGDASALDRDNAKKGKKDESQINAKKFIDRMKQAKSLEDKFKVMSDQAKRGTRGSANITANIITRADDAIYEFFFGDETGEEDENNKTIKGFMNLMKNKLNGALDKGLGFIDDKVLGPLRKKAGTESLRDWFLEKTGIKSLFDNVKGWLFGENDQKDGFLYKLGDETKDLFKKAGGYVGNAFKTVFSPVTDKVKSGWQKLNTPTEPEEREISPEEYLQAVRSGTSNLDTSKSYSLGSIAMQLEEYGGRGKRLAHSLIMAPYSIDIIESITSYLDGVNERTTNLNPAGKEKIEGLVKSFKKYKMANKKKIEEINNPKLSSARKKIEDKRRIYEEKKAHPEYEDPNGSLAADYASEGRAEAEVRNVASIQTGGNISNGASAMDAVVSYNKEIRKVADRILNQLGISAEQYYPPIVTVLCDISPTASKKDKANIGRITMRELYDRLRNLGTNKAIAVSEKIEAYMVNKLGNTDHTVGNILSGRISTPSSEDNNINGNIIPNIMQTVSTEVQKIRQLLESIINANLSAVKIVPARVRTNPLPLGGDTNTRGSRGRESETEGRSSDSDDGGIVNAAYGATFNKAGISALSKDEIYGRDGLYGKVPKTGVYNVKSGTTIYPTKKDKAIELAKEQEAINSLIYSNADAQGRATRQVNGDTYTEVEPGVWMAWVQDDKGRQKQRWIRDDDNFNMAQKVGKTAKSGAQAVISSLGYSGQIGSVTMPKNLEEAKALITKYAPKIGAGAILGGAIGLLAGNPLLGVAVGGTASLIASSEQVKTFLFGEKTQDKDGNDTGRTGGLITSGVQDAVKKYFPSMAKYGTVGATLGLLSPFGLVGGAMIGSTIGWATSNDAIREALFGKSDDPKSGLMSKETRDKLKKAMPNMIVGAGLGVLTGPFGILGNALLGSGLGLVSTTETFKSFIFGTEYVNPDGTKSREGGLMGSIRTHVIDPLKDFGFFFKDKMEDMFINGIINPIKESIKPITKDFYLLAKNALSLFPNMVNAMFDSTFGRPLTQLIDDKIVSPIANITNKLARGAVGAGTGIISAPFKAVRGIARSRQMSHIKTGNADYMTAADRLQFRKDHKVRSFGGDSYESTDEVMNLMNKDELKTSLDSMKVLQNVNKLKKDERAAGRALSAEVTKYFGTKGATWRKFKAAMQSNSIEQFSALLDTTPMANGEMMSQPQKDALLQLANAKLEAVYTSKQKQNLTKDKEKELFRSLKEKGFNVTTKNVDKISAMLQNEYTLKNKSEKQLTPEEQAANTITDSARKNTEDIISTLKSSTEAIAKILANNAPDTEKREANKKFIEEYFSESDSYDSETGEKLNREERRKRELEEAQLRARSGFQKAKDAAKNRGAGWWNKIYGNAKQYADDLANPKTTKHTAYIDGTDIPIEMEEYEETNVPAGLARVLGLGLNKKNKAASKLNTIYDKGKKAFGEELNKVEKETKEVFDPAANAFRSFRRGMNGEWVENSGKAQTSADKAEERAQNDQMNKLGLTIGSAIGKVFGTSDKDTGEKKEGLLSKLFGAVKGPLGKIAKTLGMGLLGATVVAGVGHGAGFIVPKIQETWNNHMKPWLDETFNGLGDKLVGIKDKLVSLPGQFFDWFTGNTSTGGFPHLFTNTIFPWFLEGFGKFAQYVVTPLTEVIIKTAPALIKGIGKGIWNGIEYLLHKKDAKTRPDYEKLKGEESLSSSIYSNRGNGLSSIPTVPGGSGWHKESPNTNAFDSAFGKLMGYANSSLADSKKEKAKSLQETINDPNASPEEVQKAIAESHENAKFTGTDGKTYYDHNYMPLDSKGNTILADGTVTNDNSNYTFSPFSGASSLKDRLFKGVTRRILTPGSSNGPLKLISAVGKGVSHLGVPGMVVGGTMRAAGNTGQAAFNTLDRVTGRVLGSSNFGNAVYNAGSKMASSKHGAIAAVGNRLASSGIAKEGADQITQKSLEKALKKGSLEGVGDMVSRKTGTTFAKEMGEDGIEKIVRKTAKSVTGEAMEEGAKKGLLSRIIKIIREGISNIFKSGPVVEFAQNGLREAGQEATQEAAKKVMTEASEKIIVKLTKIAGEKLAQAGAAIVAKISASIASGQIFTVVFAAYDFISGATKDARSILGLTKEQDISWLERLIAGLLKCINGFIIWGLIPVDQIVDVFVEYLAPKFGIDVSDLNARREEALKEVTEYNAQMGTDYTVEEYNKRNSLGTKIGKGLKGIIGKADENTVAEFNAKNGTNLTLEEYQSQHTFGGQVKGLGSKVMGGIKSGISSAASSIAKVGPEVLNKLKTNIKYVFTGDVANLAKSIIDVKTDEGNIDAGGMISSLVTSASLPFTGPPTIMIGSIKAIGNGLIKIVKTLKQEGPTILSKLGQSFNYMKSGDPVGLINSLGDIRTEDNNLSIGKLVGNIATGASLPFTMLPTCAIGAGKLVGKVVTTIAREAISEGPKALDKIKEIGSFIMGGDVTGLISSIGTIRDTEGDVSVGRILGSILNGLTLPLTLPLTAVIGAGKFVGGVVGKVASNISNTKELMDQNSSSIRDLAQQGELKKMFSFEVDKGEDNPLGFLQTGIGLANKLMQAPVAAFHALGNGIDKLLGTGKENDNKMVKISDIINDMKEYMDTDKHSTMDGWENIGSQYTNATGPVGIMNRLIVNSVKGIGKHVVNVVRSFGGIIDLIDKIPGVDIKESISGTGKYGLGRVSQLDPRVAGTPYNTPGDSRKQTIGNSGCGPAAAVNAVNYAYGMGPGELLEASKYALNGGWKERDGGTKPGFFTSYLGRNGLKASHIGNSSVVNSLASGDPVILMGKDTNGGNTPYGPNPHYVVANGIDRNGNIIVDDPESLAPSMRYPAGKVLGKTSMAIKASKYGTAGDYYILIGVYKNGSTIPTTISPNLQISKSDIYTSYNKPRDEQCHPVMLKHDTRSMFYMRDSVLKKIGVLTDATSYIPQGSTLTSSTNAGRTSITSGAELAKIQKSAGAQFAENVANSTKLKMQEKDANSAVFKNIGWLGVPYRDLILKGTDSEAIGVISMLCRKYKTEIKATDHVKTVKSILQSYFGINTSTIETFAKGIAKYAGITMTELKDKDNAMYLKLKNYAKINNTRSDDDFTVGYVCSLLGLKFEGDNPINTKDTDSNSNIPEDGSVSGEYYNAGMDGGMYGSTGTQQSQPTNIFDMIKNSFMNLFNYTDSSGQQKNLLSIFGIGDSGSSSGGDYMSSGSTVAGLSPQQSSVKKALESIMNKNEYSREDRYRVDATLKGSKQGSGDCSSTVQWALKTGANVDPGGYTGAQIESPNGQWVDGPYDFSNAGSSSPDSGKLAMGDLMFYGTNGSGNTNHVSHVEMYWGDGQRIGHGGGIGPKLSPYTSKSSSQRYLGAKRFIPVGSVLSSSGGSAASLGNPAPGDTESTKQVIWKFLKSKGYNDIAAAGIMGNIAQECSFNYALKESGGKGPGVGICQWTYVTRKRAFLNAVPDWQTNLPGQLDFMWSEINSGYKGVLPAAMNQCTSVTDAVWKFHQIYEGSADIQRTGGLTNRENYGAQIFSQFANTSYGTTYATGKYGLGNVVDGQISSTFNDPTRVFHSGVDIAARRGTPVKSPVSGTVIRAEENAENGKMIVVRDNSGRLYTFTHLQSSNVNVGSRVAPNTIIGTVGSTGKSSGDHLHYQMTDTEGQFVDPVAYAMGKKTAPASKQQRAIGGSNGIDYTTLINNIIQLLAIIGTNTEKINALVEAMSKIGVDTSGIDTTSNESKINAIKSSISNGINRSQQAQTVTSEIESQRLEKMTNIMRTIAAQ